MTLRTFIFDFDGVIADSGKDIANCVRHIQRKYNCRLMDNDEIYSHLGLGPAHLIKMCTGFPDGEFLDNVTSDYRQYYLAHCVEETTPCQGLMELLHYLRGEYNNSLGDNVDFSTSKINKVHLAVVTNKPESITNVILDKFGIKDYFDIVIGPESLQKLKPDPEGILKVLAFTGTKPREAVMIGDTDTDVFAGRAAGVLTCGRLGGLGNQEALRASKPDMMVGDLRELRFLNEE